MYPLTVINKREAKTHFGYKHNESIPQIITTRNYFPLVIRTAYTSSSFGLLLDGVIFLFTEVIDCHLFPRNVSCKSGSILTIALWLWLNHLDQCSAER